MWETTKVEQENVIPESAIVVTGFVHERSDQVGLLETSVLVVKSSWTNRLLVVMRFESLTTTRTTHLRPSNLGWHRFSVMLGPLAVRGRSAGS
jgi:hypothetical protein